LNTDWTGRAAIRSTTAKYTPTSQQDQLVTEPRWTTGGLRDGRKWRHMEN
jgi:hypothetical protein